MTVSSKIKTWQEFLAKNGFAGDRSIITNFSDGFWGVNTINATKKFQLKYNLNATGIFDDQTLKAAVDLGLALPQSNDFPPQGLLDVVFDLSHNNESVDFFKAKDDGMKAVIHKATQSMSSTLFHDPLYTKRMEEAINTGLLWGAYHFGSGGSGKQQAQLFLDFAKPNGSTLLILDFEPNTTSCESTMNVDEASEFVSEIYTQTGKYPGIYSGSLLHEVANNSSYSILTNCWLWKAQYGPIVHLPPQWDDYVLWQYTDGKVGPSSQPINGIGHCDRSVFKGTEEDLLTFWKSHSS